MGIADEVYARKEASDAAKRCKMGVAIDSMSDADREAILFAIDQVAVDAERPQQERLFTAAWIHYLLTNNGYEIGRTVVKEHIGRTCNCDRS